VQPLRAIHGDHAEISANRVNRSTAPRPYLFGLEFGFQLRGRPSIAIKLRPWMSTPPV